MSQCGAVARKWRALASDSAAADWTVEDLEPVVVRRDDVAGFRGFGVERLAALITTRPVGHAPHTSGRRARGAVVAETQGSSLGL